MRMTALHRNMDSLERYRNWFLSAKFALNIKHLVQRSQYTVTILLEPNEPRSKVYCTLSMRFYRLSALTSWRRKKSGAIPLDDQHQLV